MALIVQLASSGEDEKDKGSTVQIEAGYSYEVPRLGAFSPPQSPPAREHPFPNPSSYESGNKSFLSGLASTHSKPKVKRVFDEATI